jgi:hypothetical protein
VSSAGCADGKDNSIQVVPGAAAQAAFVNQPPNGFMTTPLAPAISVQVEDAYGNPVGAGVKATLSLSSNSANAVLAGAKAKTNANGVATFTAAALSKAGQGYTLVAHAGTGTSTPSAAFTIYAATHFGIAVSSASVQAGTSFTVTVKALDASGNVDPTYVGTVHLSSGATPPADYTFQPSDNGQHDFAVTLTAAGAQTLTVADATKATVKGTAAVTITPGTLHGFSLSGIPTSATVNVSYLFTVIAQDTYGNTVTGYLGTVQFSNSGGTATLPGTYPFTSIDKGRHIFKVTFTTTGNNQSLTVADQANSGDSGIEDGITVNP